MHLTLFFFCTIAVFSGIFARHGSPKSCCLKRPPVRVNVTKIVSYKKQHEGICPITAIVFTLEKGNILCSDPASPWTKMAMRKIDAKKEGKRNQMPPDAPQENTEGLLPTTMLPLASRWPQVPASEAVSMGKPRADSPSKVKPSKP